MSTGKTFVRRRGTTAIPNATVWDERLSYVALGLLAVILSAPARKGGNGYRAYMKRGAGQTLVLRALAELNEAGYRHQFTHRKGGKIVTDTIISETPMTAAEAEVFHGQQLAKSDPTAQRKPTHSTHGTAHAISTHGNDPHRASENRAWKSNAPSVPEDQGSLTSYLSKEPGETKKQIDNGPKQCRDCGRLRRLEDLTESGICTDCLPVQPASPIPEPGVARAKVRAMLDASKAVKAKELEARRDAAQAAKAARARAEAELHQPLTAYGT